MAPVAPTVKALAEKHGIDLATVTGTGKGGAVKKSDVEALIGGGSSSGSDEKKKTKGGEFYCPGCGKRTTDASEPCVGGEFGHPPIAVVPVAELDGPEESHTPAPASE
jgi:pyruvate/2-oxoglutarate dehydrogenase complex dihydrolipoamide acyltransferase (E2) component